MGWCISIRSSIRASGAQLVTRLFYMFDKETMIASMGIGGGLGNAALFTRF